jgi:hypothetical protein
MSQTKIVKRVSFSLEDEYRDLLAQIADIGRRSMTDEIRIMIDRRAEELGLKPVTQYNPKPIASIREMSNRQKNNRLAA